MKIGIDLGGSHIAICVVNNNGVIVEKIEKRLTSTEKRTIKKSIEDYIVENVNKLKGKYSISAIGIAIPGAVEDGRIIDAVNLGIENFDIVDKLHENIDIPINIKNDAKCAAIAENEYGCLKKYDRSVCLTLGTGIGGAVIINNKLLDTGKLPGCEFGHMIIQKNGLECKCGRKGCFEKYASMKALKDNLRKALGYDEKTRGQELFDIIRNNKEENKNYNIIEGIVQEYIENLAIGISNIIMIFEPEVIGLGGSFVYFQEVLLPRLYVELKKRSGFYADKQIKIETAVLGNDAGILGATLI